MIELQELSKSFDDKSIFQNLNLNLKAGQSYALIGPSGSGKTSLLNIVGKLDKDYQGDIFIEGKNLKTIREVTYFRNDLSYLFQNYGLIDNESVLENLSLAFVGKKLSKKEKQLEIRKALKRVKLSYLDLSRKIYSLSGGEAQRIALAKVILKRPKIILADEPTGALDDENALEVLDILKSLLSEDSYLLVATHNQVVWEGLDHVINISDYK
ncbi:ATP-binding cassette domain-containing protein [Streptococcus loxodontisalivarius]|uniref:ABC transport system ATP-binding protein n=1 Tax=Streptococcus loxodontisalivarius TaxID=1349415 RepID=A0ABS2PQI4_9STRE|nr:ATP-binding cassette domain-containing protein [Streptococcus loxodontisalivarius]MBM7642245.1 putative ABC transport system ATP-binding protein [Streptococcus loxodontisalivarius]